MSIEEIKAKHDFWCPTCELRVSWAPSETFRFDAPTHTCPGKIGKKMKYVEMPLWYFILWSTTFFIAGMSMVILIDFVCGNF